MGIIVRFTGHLQAKHGLMRLPHSVEIWKKTA
jgi:hypothetical protein